MFTACKTSAITDSSVIIVQGKAEIQVNSDFYHARPFWGVRDREIAIFSLESKPCFDSELVIHLRHNFFNNHNDLTKNYVVKWPTGIKV